MHLRTVIIFVFSLPSSLFSWNRFLRSLIMLWVVCSWVCPSCTVDPQTGQDLTIEGLTVWTEEDTQLVCYAPVYAFCMVFCSFLQFYFDCFQVTIHHGLNFKVSFAILYLCELDYSHKHVSLMIFVFLFF